MTDHRGTLRSRGDHARDLIASSAVDNWLSFLKCMVETGLCKMDVPGDELSKSVLADFVEVKHVLYAGDRSDHDQFDGGGASQWIQTLLC